MYSQEVKIINKFGLHARPASEFVQKACEYKSTINLEFKGKSVSAKSIIGVLSAGIRYGNDILISAEGVDEREAVEALVGLVNSNFNIIVRKRKSENISMKY